MGARRQKHAGRPKTRRQTKNTPGDPRFCKSVAARRDARLSKLDGTEMGPTIVTDEPQQSKTFQFISFSVAVMLPCRFGLVQVLTAKLHCGSTAPSESPSDAPSPSPVTNPSGEAVEGMEEY